MIEKLKNTFKEDPFQFCMRATILGAIIIGIIFYT